MTTFTASFVPGAETKVVSSRPGVQPRFARSGRAPLSPNPEYAGFNCSGVEPPALAVQAHSAPLGLAFYTGTQFPAEYQGDAFMTYHGSWNRSVPTGAKVVRVRVQNGRPVSVEDFVTGWQLPDGSRWGRPVGLVVAADGALLISDDSGGRIWRVKYGKWGGLADGRSGGRFVGGPDAGRGGGATVRPTA